MVLTSAHAALDIIRHERSRHCITARDFLAARFKRIYVSPRLIPPPLVERVRENSIQIRKGRVGIMKTTAHAAPRAALCDRQARQPE